MTTRKHDDVGVLDPHAGDAVALPESLTITVSLPVTVHEAPAHEVAVAIDEVAINPHDVAGDGPTTVSISVVQLPMVPVVEYHAGPVIPALPEPDQVFSRRRREPGVLVPAPVRAIPEAPVHPGAKPRRPAPEGVLQQFLYSITFHLVNVGDSYGARQRKALEACISKQFEGATRFVPVFSRKGGVGTTTIATLLGMALADVRDDRIIAIDANPDRGTLTDRIVKTTNFTSRDVVARASRLVEFAAFQSLVSHDASTLDVLASGSSATVVKPLSEKDFNALATVIERFYAIAIADCGTELVHSTMRAALQRADSIVIVSGGSVNEARLASETLSWLEANGYEELVKNAVLALNTGTQGTNLDKIVEIEAHFTARVREVVRIPYDLSLATGSVLRYDELRPFTRDAARDLAASVVDGMPAARHVETPSESGVVVGGRPLRRLADRG